MTDPQQAKAATLYPRSIVGVDVLEQVHAWDGERGNWFIGPVRYPRLYVWLMLLSITDVVLTWQILNNGGYEANAIAHWVMRHWGMEGAIVLKFAASFLAVCVCEYIARRNEPLSERLVDWCVAISAIPVVIGFITLYHQVHSIAC
ncbi:MAG: hypothetical protein GC159_09280 [Phycisphaera sp.]|nr:hypothetical protein [Phycisphaera sp.]